MTDIVFGQPHSERCSNTHFDDRWTCPGCYAEMGNVGEGRHTCASCGRMVECTLERVPECHSVLVEETSDEA